MFKVMGGGTWTPAMFKVMEGLRSVSHVQGDGGGGRGASAMFKVIGGGEERQPCSR